MHDDANVSNCFLRPCSSMISILNIGYQRILFYNSINTFCFCAFGLDVVFLLWRRQRRHLEPPDARVPHGVQAAGRGVPRERGKDLRQRRHPLSGAQRFPNIFLVAIFSFSESLIFYTDRWRRYHSKVWICFNFLAAISGFVFAGCQHRCLERTLHSLLHHPGISSKVLVPSSPSPFTLVYTPVHHAKFANDKIEDNFVWCIDILAGCCHYPVRKYFMFQKVSGGNPHKFVFLVWVYHQSQCAKLERKLAKTQACCILSLKYLQIGDVQKCYVDGSGSPPSW